MHERVRPGWLPVADDASQPGASRNLRGGETTMTNHPNRARTYWYASPRGFANEYTIGIATTQGAAKSYEAEGFVRIDRDRALRELVYRGDAATKAYVGVSVDGEDRYDRFDVARAIRTGQTIRPF